MKANISQFATVKLGMIELWELMVVNFISGAGGTPPPPTRDKLLEKLPINIFCRSSLEPNWTVPSFEKWLHFLKNLNLFVLYKHQKKYMYIVIKYTESPIHLYIKIPYILCLLYSINTVFILNITLFGPLSLNKYSLKFWKVTIRYMYISCFD